MNENDSKSPEKGGLKFGRAISRRDLFKGAALGAGAVAAPLVTACESKPSVKPRKIDKKVIILGLDAMDPKLLNRFWEAGELAKLEETCRKRRFHRVAKFNTARVAGCLVDFQCLRSGGCTRNL